MLGGGVADAFGHELQVAGDAQQGDLAQHRGQLLHLLEELIGDDLRHGVVVVHGRIGAGLFLGQVALQVLQPQVAVFHAVLFHGFFLSFFLEVFDNGVIPLRHFLAGFLGSLRRRFAGFELRLDGFQLIAAFLKLVGAHGVPLLVRQVLQLQLAGLQFLNGLAGQVKLHLF